MKKVWLIAGAVMLFGMGSGLRATDSTPAKSVVTVLAPGNYTAKAKALVCEGCGPIIEQTLNQQRGIKKATFDPKTKTVSFQIKKGAVVKVSDLQKTLKAKSDEMGMGADYTLTEIKKRAD
jgi:hypothetical protein